jgi:pimeloyl-ACP methyl ester carboxylesterase
VTSEEQAVVLVPGAWCRAPVWDAVAARLRAAGRTVHALTLSGLGEDPPADPGGVGLQDHVADVLGFLAETGLHDVVLVGHSYSGLVVGQAAARAPDRVARTVFVQAFLPVAGRSLIDEFGPAAGAEIRQIQDHGGWWPPPTVDDLVREPDLDAEAARELHARLVPHPGRTVLEPPAWPAPTRRSTPTTSCRPVRPRPRRCGTYRRRGSTGSTPGTSPCSPPPTPSPGCCWPSGDRDRPASQGMSLVDMQVVTCL